MMKQPFALVGFTYLLTLLAASVLGQNSAIAMLAVSAVLFVIALCYKPARQDKRLPLALLSSVIALASFCITFAAQYVPVIALDGAEAQVTGVITDLPTMSNGRYYYIVETDSIALEGAPQRVTLRLSSKTDLGADAFDKITANLHLYTMEDDGVFSSRVYYRSKGIYISAYSLEDITVSETDQKPLYYHAISVRKALMDSIDNILPKREGSLIKGILLGEDSGIPQEIRQDFRDAGISHLLAVSGTHTSIIMGFFLGLFAAFGMKKRLGSLLTAIFIFLFMALVGFSPSVVRAGIMSILYLLGIAMKKDADPVNSLGLAVLVLVIVNPFAATDIGLLLSFGASLGMILFSSRLGEVLSRPFAKLRFGKKPVTAVCHIIAQNFAAVILMLPVLILIFGEISLVSPIANILCLYPSMLMMAFGGIAAVLAMLAPIAFIAYPFTLIGGLLSKYVIFATGLLADIPYAVVPATSGFVVIWMAGTIMVLLAAVLFKKNGKGNGKLIKISVLLSVIMLLCGTISFQLFMRGVTTVTVLNMDSGQCIVIARDSKVVVIGCGGAYNAPGLAAGFLRRNGYRKIDLLMIPSFEEPYASGMPELIERCPPEMLVMPTSAESKLKDEIAAAVPQYCKQYEYKESDIRALPDVGIKVMMQGNESIMMVNIDQTSILIASPLSDFLYTDETTKFAGVSVYQGELPANFHLNQSPLVLVSGNGKQAAKAKLRLLELEVAAHNVSEYTAIEIITRGKGDVAIIPVQ